MKSGLLALCLATLTSCSQDRSLTNFSEPQVQRPIQLNIENIFSDVEKWTEDGVVDKSERMEILKKCGYKTKLINGPFCLKFTYIQNSGKWEMVNENTYQLALDQNNLGLFLSSYQR